MKINPTKIVIILLIIALVLGIIVFSMPINSRQIENKTPIPSAGITENNLNHLESAQDTPVNSNNVTDVFFATLYGFNSNKNLPLYGFTVEKNSEHPQVGKAAGRVSVFDPNHILQLNEKSYGQGYVLSTYYDEPQRRYVVIKAEKASLPKSDVGIHDF